uniref:Uncharacterized protein n=1 Tax=Arundo donax TaxID=35708 RepID=A0A0A9CMV1_ARUDO
MAIDYVESFKLIVVCNLEI